MTAVLTMIGTTPVSGQPRLSPTQAPLREVRLNIFTVDNDMPSFGDLVSNWYSARYLITLPEVREVNFYLSKAFWTRFKTLEPGWTWAGEGHGPPSRRQQIGGVTIFPRSNTSDHIRQEDLKYWMRRNLNNRLICNIAFTSRTDFILRQTKTLPNDVATFGDKAMGFYALSAASLKEAAIPFLNFGFLVVRGLERLAWTDTDTLKELDPKTGQHRRPYFNIRSSIPNRSLFITSRHNDEAGLKREPFPYIADFYGFAHSQFYGVSVYVDHVKRMARENPDNTFAIISTLKQHENITRGWEGPLPATNQMVFASRGGRREAVLRPGKSQWQVYQHKDLSNLMYIYAPNGLAFDVASRLVEHSNLPVLVTGTMSLSQAIQFDKPFLYEIAPWHREPAKDLMDVMGARNHRWVITIPRTKSDGFPNPAPDAQATGRAALAVNRARLNKQATTLFNPDLGIFSQRYAKRSKAIRAYRRLRRPDARSVNPAGNLLDNVLPFCQAAKKRFAEIRQTCGRTAEESDKSLNCVLQILKKLSADLDAY